MGRRTFLTALILLAAFSPTFSPAAAHAALPSAAQLDRAATIAASLRMPGVAWGLDAEGDQILVTVDSTVDVAKVRAVLASAGRAARIEQTPGELRILIAGGQAIYTGSSRCSLGANVRSGSTYYFVTAGHCTTLGATWYSNSAKTTVLGSRAGTSFPTNDYGIVRYTNLTVAHPSAVYTYPGTVTINGVGTAYVGQTVCRSGATTGVRCGSVTGLNQTVNYAQGVVSGLIRTNICAEPGDSGGPLYVVATGMIIGILSGGSGNCTSGGTSFYQPIGEILAAYGVTIP